MTEREVGGLDDLFAIGEERVVDEPLAVERQPHRRALWVLRNLLLVVAATVVTVAALRSAGVGVSVLLVIAAFVALRLLLLAVAEVAPPPAPQRSTPRRTVADEEGFYHWAGTDSLRSAVRRWEQRLEWSQSDPESYARNVLPVLAEITDERLRLRHGITRASDPRRARELLGEPFWQMLTDPRRRPPRARDLATYVETLERL